MERQGDNTEGQASFRFDLGWSKGAPDKFRGRNVFYFSCPRGKNYETLSEFFFGSGSAETSDELFFSITLYDKIFPARLAAPGLSAAGNFST